MTKAKLPNAKIKYLSSAFVLISAISYIHLFVRPLSFEVESFLTSTIAAVMLGSIEILLFSNDTVYGDPRKNKFAEAFQKESPINHLKFKFSLSTDKASYYWFEQIFNPMSSPNNARHQQWKRTLQRGFMCRFVVIIRKTCFWTVTASVTSYLIDILLFYIIGIEIPSHNISLFDKLLFILIMMSFWIIVSAFNKAKSGTGVWKRFSEINRLHKSWIDENIKTLNDIPCE